LTATPSFHALALDEQQKLSDNLNKIAAYSAELIRDDWLQSRRLGQIPVVRRRQVIEGPFEQAQAAADDFRPAAANQIARVTQETLRAVAFPTFVADLIKGTFNAIVQSSIQQMEAYAKLLENVSKTVDQFMADNISDPQARDWLAQSYPDHITVQGGQAVARDGADDRPTPNFRADLNLNEDVTVDSDTIEETLVPAARRRLAQSRLQLLSTMVLLGMNRIVVTGGKIRATMGFHIDATDRAHQEHATDFDFRAAAAGSFGFGPWSVSASTSVSYVNSTRANSDSELNVQTDLTGEVEIHFKSDYFPLERFANAGAISRIQGNTPVPEANTPPVNPVGDAPAAGGDVGPYRSPRARPVPSRAPTLPPIGSPLPEARTPVRPTQPIVERRVNGNGAATPEAPAISNEGDTAAQPAANPPAENVSAAPAGSPENASPSAAPPGGATPAADGPTTDRPAATTPPSTSSPTSGGGGAIGNAVAGAIGNVVGGVVSRGVDQVLPETG
jgi:hypothetical protein